MTARDLVCLALGSLGTLLLCGTALALHQESTLRRVRNDRRNEK